MQGIFLVPQEKFNHQADAQSRILWSFPWNLPEVQRWFVERGWVFLSLEKQESENRGRSSWKVVKLIRIFLIHVYFLINWLILATHWCNAPDVREKFAYWETKKSRNIRDKPVNICVRLSAYIAGHGFLSHHRKRHVFFELQSWSGVYRNISYI